MEPGILSIINPVVATLPVQVPFVGFREMERNQGKPFRLHLGANESPWGMSLLAQQAIIEQAGSSYYPDPLSYDLKEQLGNNLGVHPDNLLVGSGVDDLLGLIARTFVRPGVHTVHTAGTYPTFQYFVSGCGGTAEKVCYGENHRVDTKVLAEKAHACKAKVVYLVNPDNPTGQLLGPEEIMQVYERMPLDCVLVLDEAYLDFVPGHKQMPYQPAQERMIRLRSFSKVYGLAGLRIGYCIAHTQVMEAFNKIRVQYGVNYLAQVAAEVSLGDKYFLQQVLQKNAAGISRYQALAQKLGIRVLPSYTNFVFFDLGAVNPALLQEALAREGVFVRVYQNFNGSTCMRVTVGTEKEQAAFAQFMEGFMQQTR